MGATFAHDFLYEFVTLFVILDPVATVPIFLFATAGLARGQALKVAGYALGVAFLVLLFFIAGGHPRVPRGKASSAHARTVDVAPTLASFFGVGKPKRGWDGFARL